VRVAVAGCPASQFNAWNIAITDCLKDLPPAAFYRDNHCGPRQRSVPAAYCKGYAVRSLFLRLGLKYQVMRHPCGRHRRR
jgi:hypothetical protein